MIALVVSPDYASHYLPLSSVAGALRRRGAHVVVATGAGLAPAVAADGFEHRILALGAGSNPGLIRVEEQEAEEAQRLEAFFAATRRGAAAALAYQAEQRLHDLLWDPPGVTARLAAILDEVRADVVLVDQLAYGATLALRALEQPYVSLLPGHPSQLPPPGLPFGLPPYFPPGLEPAPEELARLGALCDAVRRRFAHAYGDALGDLNAAATAPDDPFAEPSPWLTLVNYPAVLARHLPQHPNVAYVGSLVRDERADPALQAELDALPRPRVYASLGSFLSARGDVLEGISEAFGRSWSLVLASGVADADVLGGVPGRRLVRAYLPQVGVLPSVDLAVCHGGNNTVTEALTAGVPLLVGPFSSDQFAGADDVRRAGVGTAFDPNGIRPRELERAARTLLRTSAPARAAALGRMLRGRPGARYAAGLVLGVAAAGSPSRRRTASLL